MLTGSTEQSRKRNDNVTGMRQTRLLRKCVLTSQGVERHEKRRDDKRLRLAALSNSAWSSQTRRRPGKARPAPPARALLLLLCIPPLPPVASPAVRKAAAALRRLLPRDRLGRLQTTPPPRGPSRSSGLEDGSARTAIGRPARRPRLLLVFHRRAPRRAGVRAHRHVTGMRQTLAF